MDYNKILIVGIIILLGLIVHKLTNNNIKYFLFKKYKELCKYINNFTSNFKQLSIHDLLNIVITKDDIFTTKSDTSNKIKATIEDIKHIKKYLKKTLSYYKTKISNISFNDIYYYKNIKGFEFKPFNINCIFTNNNTRQELNLNIFMIYKFNTTSVIDNNGTFYIKNIYINNNITETNNSPINTLTTETMSESIDIPSINLSTATDTLSSNI